MKHIYIFLVCLLISCLVPKAASQDTASQDTASQNAASQDTVSQAQFEIQSSEIQPKQLVLSQSNQDGIFTQENWYIWGADVIKVADSYYMFYSRWPKETGMAGWLTHSEIALAISNNAAGPFRFQQTVFTGADDALTKHSDKRDSWDSGMVHSPQVLEYQGMYYLYYTGVPKLPENPEQTEARQYLKDKRRLGVAVSDSPEGPWQRFDTPLIAPNSAGDLDSLATANPAILEKPEGGFLLVYKGIKQENEHQQISLLAATSDHPLGPFTVNSEPILDNTTHIEDPDIWYQQGYYLMLAHDVTGYYSKAPDGRSLALFQSKDGFKWQAANHALASRRRVNWDDGTTTYFQRFERPHILVENGEATMVYVAVKEAEGIAYNVAVPVTLK